MSATDTVVSDATAQDLTLVIYDNACRRSVTVDSTTNIGTIYLLLNRSNKVLVNIADQTPVLEPAQLITDFIEKGLEYRVDPDNYKIIKERLGPALTERRVEIRQRRITTLQHQIQNLEAGIDLDYDSNDESETECPGCGISSDDDFDDNDQEDE
jgi:hypothetical protein